jgi:serine phosphatase RsbU (regulator of sigma subunit)
MNAHDDKEQKASATWSGIRDTVISDLRQEHLKRNVHRDLKDLYAFYLDEDARERLAEMRRGKRWLNVLGWLLKSLILNLPPIHRLLLLVSFFLFVFGDTQIYGFEFQLQPVGFLILLLVLMLELKDKILARDELEVGRAVQLALLPDTNPMIPGWDIWLYTRPANDVGGDLVDYLWVDHGQLGMALGDVSGKGLGAALLMAKLQATLRALATEFTSLEDLGSRMNAIFCRDRVPGRFATMVYLEFGESSGEVRVLNAGHLPPVLVQTGSTTTLDPVAPPLGILPKAEYLEQKLMLGTGDLLAIFSDGVTEAENVVDDMFGEEKVNVLLERLRERSPAEIGRRLIAEVEEFSAADRLADDLSLIVMKRTA